MVTINRKVIRVILIFMVFLLIAVYLVGPRFGAINIFDSDQPGSVAVWFESFLYLVSAGLLALLALDQDQQRSRNWRWGILSAFMLYLSINATTQINSKLIGKLLSFTPRISGRLFYLVLFGVLAVALIVILWPVLKDIPARFRLMLFLSGIVYGLGAVVVNDFDNLLFRGNNLWFYLIEELLIFAGLLILITTLIACLAYRGSPFSLNFQDDTAKKPEGGN